MIQENNYISSMRTTLKDYYKTVEGLVAKKENNLQRYSDHVAREENALVDQAIENEYLNSKQKLENIFTDAKHWLSYKMCTKLEDITDDSKFYSGDYPLTLTHYEISRHIDKYVENTNFTMLKMIDKYITDNKVEGYDDLKRKIHLGDEQVLIYGKFATTAKQQLGVIRSNAMQTHLPSTLGSSIESFASVNIGNVFSIIGKGKSISYTEPSDKSMLGMYDEYNISDFDSTSPHNRLSEFENNKH